MAIKLQNKQDVYAPDGTWPYGDLIDDTGANDGTPVDKQVYGDFHQYFARLLAVSGITANGLFDNATNGFQYYEALQRVCASYKDEIIHGTGTSVLGFAEVGSIVYGVGSSAMTFILPPSIFTGGNNVGKKICIVNVGAGLMTIQCSGAESFFIPETVTLKQGDAFEAECNGAGWTITNRYHKQDSRTLKKVIIIQAWNMDSTPAMSVAHGLDFHKIRSVHAMIQNDATTNYYPFEPLVSSSFLGGGTIETDATNITLTRMSNAQATSLYNGINALFVGPMFDYNGPGIPNPFNRGYVTVEYEY